MLAHFIVSRTLAEGRGGRSRAAFVEALRWFNELPVLLLVVIVYLVLAKPF